MCGIYGVVGPAIVAADMQVLRTLAFLNQLRGTDATGFLRIKLPFSRLAREQKVDLEITKDIIPAQDFMMEKKNYKIFNEITQHAVMGHNRSATVGDSDAADGAHPFENRRFIGMHNGTLRERRFTDHKDFATDSEALYNEMETNGVVDTLSKMSAESAFALAFYDKFSRKICFVRNDKRPLYFAVNQSRNVFYYSSTAADLRYALARSGIKGCHVYSLPAWKLVSCCPRDWKKMDMTYEDEAKTPYQTNGWSIEELTHTPDESDVPIKKTYFGGGGTVTYYSGGTQKRDSNFSATDTTGTTGRVFNSFHHCVLCGDLIRFNKEPEKNAKWQRDLGSVCFECRESFTALGFDFTIPGEFSKQFTEFMNNQD